MAADHDPWLVQTFEDVRRRCASDRLDVLTSSNPGRFTTAIGQLVVAPDKTLWVVGHGTAERLDSLLWAGLHEDPDADHLGRFRVTVEAV